MLELAVDETWRLVVLTSDDSGALWRTLAAEKPRLRAWSAQVETLTNEHDVGALVQQMRQGLAEETLYPFLIVNGGELAGLVTLTVDADNGVGHLSYFVTSAVEGSGLASRAVRTLMDAAIERLHLARFQVEVVASNSRGSTLAERVGFSREGTLRSAVKNGGQREDVEVYGLVVSRTHSR